MTAIRRRVYVASPIPTGGTSRYDSMLGAVRNRYPDARVIPARGQWRDTEHWLTRWPQLLPSLDVVVVFAEPDGVIGCSTYREMADASRAGCEVYVVSERHRWWALDGPAGLGTEPPRWWALEQVMVRLVDASERTLARWATVAFPDRAPLLYVAGPRACDAQTHDRIVAAVRADCPGYEIVEARYEWRDGWHWRACWTGLVAELAVLVAYCEPGGIIGSGVAREIREAAAAGVLVYVASSPSRIVPLAEVEITPRRGRLFSPRRAARVTFPPARASTARRSTV